MNVLQLLNVIASKCTLVSATLFIFQYSYAETTTKEKTLNSKELSQKLLCNIIKEGIPSTDEILSFSKIPGAQESLLSTYGNLKLATLNVFMDLGRPLLPENEEKMIPERLGPIISNPNIIRFLISLLQDTDRDIRNRVSTALVELVPSSLLKQYSDKIISAVNHYQDMDGAILLSGKLDSPEAMNLLDLPSMENMRTSDDFIMARARLGDKMAEEAIIRAYHNTTDPKEKGALALRLGYVSSTVAIRLLAQEIRTPEYYYWNKKSRRSLRIHIIQGLHKAYPLEEIFWVPFYRPTDDSYYEKIEEWLNRKLNITWPSSRPSFLYQEDAPSAPR